MKLLTQREFCALLKISRQTFQNWLAPGSDNKLKDCAFKIGREWRVDIAKYFRLIQKKEEQ